MANLRTYLDENGIRKSEFADSLGISRGYLSELMGGTKVPSLELAVRIQRLTSGAICAESWVPGELPKPAEDAA